MKLISLSLLLSVIGFISPSSASDSEEYPKWQKKSYREAVVVPTSIIEGANIYAYDMCVDGIGQVTHNLQDPDLTQEDYDKKLGIISEGLLKLMEFYKPYEAKDGGTIFEASAYIIPLFYTLPFLYEEKDLFGNLKNLKPGFTRAYMGKLISTVAPKGTDDEIFPTETWFKIARFLSLKDLINSPYAVDLIMAV